MAYLHGVRVKENPTAIPAAAQSQGGVPIVIGTAPVNLAETPAVNEPVMCRSFAEAANYLGYSEDYGKYTLCQAMDSFFKLFAVGPVVFINVLDPATHRRAMAEETVAVEDGLAVCATDSIIASTVLVKNGETELVLGTDYTLSFNEYGKLAVAVVASGVTSVKVSGYCLDPAAVTANAIVGSYQVSTGKRTGIECVEEVYPKFNRFPSLLLAPGWSQLSVVGLSLAAKCEGLNGMFSCECVVDIPADDSGAVVYTDVERAKTALGYSDEHMIALWPEVVAAGKRMYFSALYAAMAINLDVSNDDVPNLYPSNKALKASGAALHDGTEVSLDQVQASELNGAGIVTVTNMNGFKAWGNNTTIYPDSTDPKDRWIGCRRFFSWWGNNFIVNYLTKVDNPANYRLIESIVDSENVRGNALVSAGKCAGIRTEYAQEDNPIANVLDGHLVFRQYLAPYTPAEDILSVLEYDVSMLEAALGGEA